MAADKFKKNIPEHLCLHWDGKRLKDTNGKWHENKVIVVSGTPNYIEGKILGKNVYV